MKLIGLLGGMSWESTALYYRMMNEAVRARLGHHHSARILLHSVDFQQIEQLQQRGDWPETARILGGAARGLRAGGAEFLVIATNTMHKVAGQIAEQSGLEVLHIADPTGAALVRDGISRAALLGTRYTMEQDFYRDRLTRDFGLEIITPDTEGRNDIHRIIYDELCQGTVNPQSAARFSRIISDLGSQGAEAVILGCTEITMIVDSSDCPLPVYDTTALHAAAAIDYAIGDD